MKNRIAIAAMLTLAEAMQSEVVGQGHLSTSKPPEQKTKSVKKPFHEQDGIKRLISDYNEIKLGTSKKGVLKRNRVIEKVESYLKKGMLKEEHLTQQGTALKP